MESKKEEINTTDTIQIKIQTFDCVYPLTIKRGATIQDLKEKISESMDIPTTKQRLIFQGKLLQGTEKLKFYKISEDSVIHMVAKTLDETTVSNTNTSTNGRNNNLILVVETNNLNNNITANANSQTSETNELRDELLPTFIEFPMLRSRRQRRRRAPHFDLSECFESMHQNMSTIHNLLNSRMKYDDQQISQTKTIVPFDFNKVKYEVGQWVDVKDTIDQWLEAQVIQVRNNQAYVHYNGWGTRWDEWIDFNSPRIAAFKTYTTQSPTALFLSPYPSVPCDANLEPQHRSIDSFFYLEKSVGNMNEICKTIDYMSKLRKKNLNRFIEIRETILKEEKEKRHILKDDFVEDKDKENQHKQNTNSQINFNNYLNSNDHELLFNTAQLIPLLDRCGRMLCDMSLHLSHLVLNPSLYPQLLLGHNQNIEVSDTLSCTSGYSMYTNESSSITGMPGHNILQNFRGNIQNSNQLITDYNMNHPNIPNTGNTQQHQTHSNRQYNIGGSSLELPFIQRIQNSNNQTQTNGTSVHDSFPKINLQVPSLLSPGETLIQNGFNPYQEPNIDIYVHTVVAPNQTTPSNLNNNTGNPPQITNPNIIRNPFERITNNNNSIINPNNVASINPGGIQNYSINSLINQNMITNRSNNPNINPISSNTSNLETETINRSAQTNQLTINPNNSTQNNQSEIINNLLGNLMNIIGSNGNRRGSTTSESSNTSYQPQNPSNNINNLLNANSGISNLNTPININSGNTTTSNYPFSNRIVQSSQTINTLSTRVANQNNSANNSTYKETSSQTDMTLNLLSLNKDNNYNDHMIEISSNKSDKNFSIKNKNTVSYKSLSEISEFEQYDVEEPSDFVIRTKKQDKSVCQSSKLNESIHSINSQVSKDFDDREDNENYRKFNR